jgi:hypothetical protein
METNHVCSRSLAAALVLVGLVTFCYGPCSATLCQEGPTRVVPEPGPCLVGMDGCAFAQAEDTGYACPTRVTPWTPEGTEQEYVPEPTSVMDEDYAPEPTCVMGQGYAPEPTCVMDMDYAPEPTSVMDEDYVPEPTDVMVLGYVSQPADETEQPYLPGPTEVLDNSGSVHVVPF